MIDTKHLTLKTPRDFVGPIAIFAAFSLPLPTAWGSVGLVLLLTTPFLHGQWAQQWQRIKSSPPAWIALIFFALYVVGAIYSVAPAAQINNFLGKYAKLLILPLLVAVLDTDKWRRLAMHAFLIAAGLAATVSYARFFGLIQQFPDPNQAYTAFQNRISFGTYLAFAAYLLAWRAIHDAHKRWFWATLALLYGLSVLMINNGRTGYVIILALVILLFFQKFGIKGVGIGLIAVSFLGSAAFFLSPTSHERITRTVQNFEKYKIGNGATETSTGLRLQFYYHSLQIISKHPVFGTGTGSFPEEYAKSVAGTSDIRTSNPHNEYFLTAVQLGLVGLAMLFIFGFYLWQSTISLTGENKAALEGLVLTIGIGCLFNSQLLDAGEGRFFVVLSGIILGSIAGDKSAPR